MAYKFQVGSAILSGALTQEGTIEVKNDSGTKTAEITTAGVVSGSSATVGSIALAGTAVSSTAAELNLVDGSSAGTVVNSKAVIYGSSGEVNATTLSGSSATIGALAIDGTTVSSTAAELNLVDGSSAGTVVNSKAVIYGGSGQVNGTSLSASNAISGKSLAVSANIVGHKLLVDDGSEIGTDSDTDMITLNNGSNITIASDLELRVGNLTQNRVPVVGANSKLEDHSNFTFSSDVLAVPGVSASVNISASQFYGDGSKLSGITADTIDVTASTANTTYELVFVGDLGSDKKLGGSTGLTFNPGSAGGGLFQLSGSAGGAQSSIIAFGDTNNYVGRETDGGDAIFSVKSTKGIDISGSGQSGIVLYTGHDPNEAGVIVQGFAGLKIADESEATNAFISGSGAGQLASLKVADLTDGRVVLAGTGGELEDSNKLTFNAGTGALTVAGAISGSGRIDGQGLRINVNGIIGTTGDTDLLTLKNGQLDVAGNVAAGGTVSGSGNFSIGGTLKADNLASATVDLTSDLMVIDDGAAGDIKTTSLANYATALAAGSNEGLSSTAGRLGVDLNDLAAAVVDVSADSIAIIDANDSNGTKKESIVDLVAKVAGAGLAASNGVLSTQAGAVTAATGGGDLSEGYNFLTGALDASEAFTVKLPSGSNGDVVVLKAQAMGAGAKVVINRSGSQTIDGETSIELESPYAAVSLVYVTDNDWRIV